MFFAAIAIGIIIARSTEYTWWAKILIAYAIFYRLERPFPCS